MKRLKFTPQREAKPKKGFKSKITECEICMKVTWFKELEENAKFGGYGFQKICNRCADKIDAKQDEQQQDKY